MSLLYEYQLLDELPMIYATCVPYWIAFSHGRSKLGRRVVAAQISAAAAALTIVYLYYRYPIIHQAAYGVLTLVVVIKCLLLTREYCHDPVASRHLYMLCACGTISFITGWLFWNIDIHMCHFWRSTRREVGMPWGFLLEGHGWWHLLTGYGIYFFIVSLEYLGLFLQGNGENEMYELMWSFGLLPHLDLKANADDYHYDNKKRKVASRKTRNGMLRFFYTDEK